MNSSGLEPIDHVYQVTSRHLGSSSACDDPGELTDPAVPFRQLASSDQFPGQQAWEWCDSATVCDPIGMFDWFQPKGDHWQRVSATIVNAPDNGTACDLELATLTIAATDANVHVDLLERSAGGDPNSCTSDQALLMLANTTNCRTVDHYDLAP